MAGCFAAFRPLCKVACRHAKGVDGYVVTAYHVLMTTIYDGTFWMHSKQEYEDHVKMAIKGVSADEMPDCCGIYILANSVNGWVYIGRSVNMRKRAKLHLSSMQSGSHINKRLVSAFQEYGESAFKFHAMWVCEPKDAWLLEKGAMFRMDVEKTYNIQNLFSANSTYYRKSNERWYC